MARPPCPRRVEGPPTCDYFKPRGVPMTELEEVALSVDELEALRLADLEELYQDAAAERMGVSRATFGRIIATAHRKVADALVRGKALRISGGAVAWSGVRAFACESCENEWTLPFATGRPDGCPECGSEEFSRTDRGALGAAKRRTARRKKK